MTERDQRVERARSETIEAFGDVAEELGFRPSWGRVYAIVYLADGGLTFDRLVDESRYYRTTVSDALDGLSDLGLVEVEPAVTDENAYTKVRRAADLAAATGDGLAEKLRADGDSQIGAMAELTSLLEDGPKSFEEIVDATDYTAIEVNDLIHGLLEFDAVAEVDERDGTPVFDVTASRAERTRTELSERTAQAFEAFADRLEDAGQHLEASDSAAVTRYRERISELKEYAERTDRPEQELPAESLFDFVYGRETGGERA